MKKKLISCLIILALCVSVFAGCARTNFGEEDLAKALKNLEAEMKLITGTTPSSYNVPNKLGEEYYITDADGNPATIYVEWKVEGSEDVTLKDNGDTTTVVIPANRTSAILYSLKATLVDENGKAYTNSNDETYTATFVCNAPVSSGGQDPQQPGGQDPQQPGGQEPGGQEPSAENTKETAYTVAKALEIINGLDLGATYSKPVYVKGVVTYAKAGSDSEWNLDIKDSASDSAKLIVWWPKLSSSVATSVAEGDTVIVYGYLINFNKSGASQPEMADTDTLECSIVSVTKGTGGSGGGTGEQPSTPPTTGAGTSIDSPYTVAQAIEEANKLASGAYSTGYYYVRGVVGEISYPGDATKSWSFDMTDAGGTDILKGFYVYLGSGMTTVDEGDVVIVYGKLQNYKGNTPEITTKSSDNPLTTLVKNETKGLTGDIKTNGTTGGGTGGGTTSGDPSKGITVSGKTITITFSSMEFADQTVIPNFTAGGVTLTFAGGGNTNAPKYYTSGSAMRMYGSNTLTISGATISKVEFTFGSSDTPSKEITANGGTYSDGTWTGSSSNLMFTIANGSGNRRIASITITLE